MQPSHRPGSVGGNTSGVVTRPSDVAFGRLELLLRVWSQHPEVKQGYVDKTGRWVRVDS